jgi:glucose/mannose-6-phosphate isomerase
LAGDVPQSCTLAKQVVICGMGGSALGARIVDALFPTTMRTPMEIFTEYYIPGYVGSGTLVIISSYSGNTEETIEAFYKASQKNAQVFGITTDGQLAELLRKYNYPGYIFEARNNPSGQPRLALGYSVGAIMAVLSRCEFISLTNEEMEGAIKTTRKALSDYGADKPESENLAKKMARELKGRFPIIVASEHLKGAAYALKNQLNETAKTFSVLFDIPELNHHLIEGLRNPAQMKEYMSFVVINSDLYSERVKLRYPITKDVLEKNGIAAIDYQPESDSKLEQVFEMVAFGSFVQYYLAMIYDVNPSEVAWVDYFKKELANAR